MSYAKNKGKFLLTATFLSIVAKKEVPLIKSIRFYGAELINPLPFLSKQIVFVINFIY